MLPPKKLSKPENRSVGVILSTDGVVKFEIDRIEELHTP